MMKQIICQLCGYIFTIREDFKELPGCYTPQYCDQINFQEWAERKLANE